MSVIATCLGYPRIGHDRELKRALERRWSGRSSVAELDAAAAELRQARWTTQRAAGSTVVPSNDFSLYDHVLDTALLLGAVPSRYTPLSGVARMFAMARGHQASGIDIPALEMTKWFDTNYHYIVPELAVDQAFALDADKVLAEVEEARRLGIETRPVLVGPSTFAKLSKLAPGAPAGARTVDLVDRIVPVFQALLKRLAAEGVAWVQLDEPCLAGDLDPVERDTFVRAWRALVATTERPRLFLASYFGPLGPHLPMVAELGVDALHLDLVRGPAEIDAALTLVPPSTVLSLGVVDGRNVWRTDLDRAHALVRRAVLARGEERVWVSSSCSLLHSPVDVTSETRIDPEVRSWLAFADQKLHEIAALARAAGEDVPSGPEFEASRAALVSRRVSAKTHDPSVRRRLEAVTDATRRRPSPYGERAVTQRRVFALPLFPTTTIGSFPQTPEVRNTRAAWRDGRVSDQDYERFLREETARCVARQEALGLDVLVHGEFERNDMVEYFGEQLAGFVFTELGWVQSYGSRCVKPPILYGDVSRPGPMTVAWSVYAQSLTSRPMKGMLTGPITILQWSFVRDDQPRSETASQIALALRDEVVDLEAGGISMIQVDEPAVREGLPLRRADQADYLAWAVAAFRLATSGVRDATQIHTHMCYSEFGDILDAIAALDADVLSIETSRSQMELLGDFGRSGYPNEVGPGVYDIHSPRVPSRAEMVDLLRRAVRVLPAERLWVNPDCGLKTRRWPEVEAALADMVAAAREMREEVA